MSSQFPLNSAVFHDMEQPCWKWMMGMPSRNHHKESRDPLLCPIFAGSSIFLQHCCSVQGGGDKNDVRRMRISQEISEKRERHDEQMFINVFLPT